MKNLGHEHLRLRALELACDSARQALAHAPAQPAEIVARAQAFLDFLDPPVVEKCAAPAAFVDPNVLVSRPRKYVRRKAAAKPARAKRGTRQQKAAVKLRATARKAVRK